MNYNSLLLMILFVVPIYSYVLFAYFRNCLNELEQKTRKLIDNHYLCNVKLNEKMQKELEQILTNKIKYHISVELQAQKNKEIKASRSKTSESPKKKE